MRKIIHKAFNEIVIFLKGNKKTAIVLLSIAIFVDIFFVKTSSDFVIFGILFIYVIFTKIFHLKSESIFLLCLGLLVAMFISYLFSGSSVPAEKAAVWLVLFLAVGIVQQWRE